MSGLIKSKFKAMCVHFLATCIVAGLSAVLIFAVWFPDGLARYLGGTELFLLVVSVELVVGPIMSLVIYNPAKSVNELFRDYFVVSLIQLSALIYGLYVVSESRPLFHVLGQSSSELVVSIDMSEQDFAGAKVDSYSRASWFGPLRVCFYEAKTAEEIAEAALAQLNGEMRINNAKYYETCDGSNWIEKSMPKEALAEFLSTRSIELTKMPEGEFTWMQVKHRFGSMIEIYPESDFSRAYYLETEPRK